jgi:hypothetical protein
VYFVTVALTKKPLDVTLNYKQESIKTVNKVSHICVNKSPKGVCITYPKNQSKLLALYTMVTGSFPVVKRSGRGADNPTPFSDEFKERVEIYLCSPDGPSWPVLG